MATNFLTAEITQALSAGLEISTTPTTFFGHLQYNALRAGVSGGLSMAILKTDLSDALLHVMTSTASGTLGGWGANQLAGLGDFLNFFERKLAHGVLGAGMGAILSPRHPFRGVLPGFIGGALSEIIAEGTVGSLGSRTAGNLGLLGASTMALLLNQDVDIANATAGNAINNNFNRSLNIWQEAQDKPLEQFVGDMIKEECPDSIISSETHERLARKYIALYYRLQMVTASYDVSNPGLARFERNASMTLDELRAERFAQMDPRKLALPEYRRQAERIVVNEYHHLQTLKVALALGVFVGVGSLRQTAKTLPPQRAPQVGNVVYDYSTPEAAYSLRIDPHTGKGPMAIDSRLFTSADSYTKLGAPRNSVQFWKLWDEKYPGTLSTQNLQLIQKNLSPKVDSHWLQHFPEHQHYIGKKLEHHHLDHGVWAIPLPEPLHRRDGNYGVWHQ